MAASPRHRGAHHGRATLRPRSRLPARKTMLARYGRFKATIVRPGKVAGPHDPQRGLTYWVRRAAQGGRVALPGDPQQPVQVIDSRDLARLVVQLVTDADRPWRVPRGRPGRPGHAGPPDPDLRAGSQHRSRDRAGTEECGARVLPPSEDELARAAAQPSTCQSSRDARHSARGHSGRRAGLGPPARPADPGPRLHPRA